MTPERVPPQERGFQERVTIKAERLDYELLHRIVSIYDQVAGTKAAKKLQLNSLDKIREGLRTSNTFEYRFGSSLDSNSKLFIRQSPFSGEIYFYFDPNIASGDPETDKTAADLEMEFTEAVNKFLKSNAGHSEQAPED